MGQTTNVQHKNAVLNKAWKSAVKRKQKLVKTDRLKW